MQDNKLFPVFAARDLRAAIDFYTSKLGFSNSWIWGEPPTRAEVSLGNVEIQLDCGDAGAPPGPSVVYCHLTDVDAWWAADNQFLYATDHVHAKPKFDGSVSAHTFAAGVRIGEANC
jgi:catechol 2,3-dioxygenase-like lactoylglutathione lyase family enzyme